MLVGEKVPSEPPTAAGQIVLSPTNQQKREKIRKIVYFGVRRTMRKGSVNVVCCFSFLNS